MLWKEILVFPAKTLIFRLILCNYRISFGSSSYVSFPPPVDKEEIQVYRNFRDSFASSASLHSFLLAQAFQSSDPPSSQVATKLNYIKTTYLTLFGSETFDCTNFHNVTKCMGECLCDRKRGRTQKLVIEFLSCRAISLSWCVLHQSHANERFFGSGCTAEDGVV